jgi:ParB family protein of integrating conjugative element (PFGI_1 class)
MKATTSRLASGRVYVPESQSIAETIKIMEKRGKLSLRIKGQISEDELAARINQPGPKSTAADLRPGDELDGSSVTLPVMAIQPYDRNPRTSPNPRYHEIKASIRERRGLKGNLTVTKRPPGGRNEPYMLYMGGNTRLQIVKELFEETGDPCFAQITCVYHDWVSEADVLASHLIENEARGDTLFVEKARGLIDLAREIERETGRIVTARDLQATTARMGMVVNQATVVLYQFAIDHLQPLGPWLTRENVSAIKRRFSQHEVLAATMQRDGAFTAQYPDGIQRSQGVFAKLLEDRQASLREAGDHAAVIALRGDTLKELLHGFDHVCTDVLGLNQEAAKRLSAALDAAGKDSIAPEVLRASVTDRDDADAGSTVENAVVKTNVGNDAIEPKTVATSKRIGTRIPDKLATAIRGGSTPPRIVPPKETGTVEIGVPSAPALADAGMAAEAPVAIAPGEDLSADRLNEFGTYFFRQLRSWCDVTRIEQWLEIRCEYDLPFLFWIELPDEMASTRAVCLDSVPDPEFGTLEPNMLLMRASSYRLIALLAGQLGGVIQAADGGWTNETTFAERLPAESAWRTAALVDYMSLDAMYNYWEEQLGGVTYRKTCQLALAPHDLLSVLQEPFLAERWHALTAAYGLWGQALAVWRNQTGPSSGEQ